MSGTMWNDDVMTCDYTDHVECGNRPYPDGSTQPQPTSTTEKTTTTTEKMTTADELTSTSSTGPYTSTTTKTPPMTTSSNSGAVIFLLK